MTTLTIPPPPRLPTVHALGEERLQAIPMTINPGKLDEILPIPPPLAVLIAAEEEVERALNPAGIRYAAAFAAMLIESYPQRQEMGPTYAQAIATRMAVCPSDLMGELVDYLLNTSTKGRPTPGEVYQAVNRVVGARRALRRHIKAGIVYWQYKETKSRQDAGELMPRAELPKRPKLGIPQAPAPSAEPRVLPTPPRPVARPLTPEQLAQARAMRKPP